VLREQAVEAVRDAHQAFAEVGISLAVRFERVGIPGAAEQKTRLRNQDSSLGMQSILGAESMRNVTQRATD
jgi:hypothetical protein